MLRGLKERFHKSIVPEHSLPLRLLILVAMLVAYLAIARVAPKLWPHVIAAALGTGLGHWYSYRNLEKNRQAVRAIMFVAIHLALVWLFIGLFEGLAVPQAQFAIFTQAVTSFDLRTRRSLFNTLIHSLANLYVAASLSRTFELGLYLILFAGFVLAAYFVAEREDGLKTAKLRPKPVAASFQRPLMLFSLSFGAIAIVGIIVTFLFTPRFTNNPIIPPFTINAPLQGGVEAEIINPGVPLVQINGWSDGTSDYFYGFDTNLDLRYRGGLSDDIVMYVRSPSRSYWRSHSYDYYTGITWEQSDKTLIDIEEREKGIYFLLDPPPGSPLTASEVAPASGSETEEPQRIVQSFTIVRDQPNLLFAAYRPAEILMLTERIALDRGDGIRLPETLQAGLTYSVISYRPEFDPEQLRRDSGLYPAEISERYLQLPGNISERVKNLARSLTAPYDNNYDRVMALNDHLFNEYPYNFFPPPHPPGAEVVDTFLFEDKEGVCEQYVTALVVMARSLGIPARLATGYGSGAYNPVTNYYEVRFSDAHSWAEVYFPLSGWVPFDPTPGWTPQPYPTPVQNWFFANRGFLGVDLPAAPLGAIVSSDLAGLAFFIPFLAASAALVGLGLLVIYLSKRFRLAWSTRAAGRYTSLVIDPRRRLVLKLYYQALNLLSRRRYRRRQDWETMAEYANEAGHLPGLTQLTQAAEIAAYRPDAPEADTIAQAERALAALKADLSQTRPPTADGG